MEELAAGDAGEEIFGTAGIAHHLMGKDRPEDDDPVVVKDGPVDIDRHPLLQPATREFFNLVLLDPADADEGFGQVPAMIEKIAVRPAGAPLFNAYAIEGQDPLVGKRGVGAEGNHEVEAGNNTLEMLAETVDHQRQRAGAGGVGGENQDLLAGKGRQRQGPLDNPENFRIV